MFKTANVGSADRVLRVGLGALLIAAPFVVSSALWANPVFKIGSLVVGAVLVLTALVRFCPLYRVIGASTCKAS